MYALNIQAHKSVNVTKVLIFFSQKLYSDKIFLKINSGPVLTFICSREMVYC